MKENSLMEVIYADISRNGYEKSFAGLFNCYFARGGGCYKYIFWLRLTHYYKMRGKIYAILACISYLFLKHYERRYDVHVNSNIEIGPGFVIMHGSGVYGNAASIGENCTIYQHVTIGNSAGRGIPVIGDNVTIYAGAVVAGNIKVGNNVVIGANTVVTRDVLCNHVVKMNNIVFEKRIK